MYGCTTRGRASLDGALGGERRELHRRRRTRCAPSRPTRGLPTRWSTQRLEQIRRARRRFATGERCTDVAPADAGAFLEPVSPIRLRSNLVHPSIPTHYLAQSLVPSQLICSLCAYRRVEVDGPAALRDRALPPKTTGMRGAHLPEDGPTRRATLGPAFSAHWASGGAARLSFLSRREWLQLRVQCRACWNACRAPL